MPNAKKPARPMALRKFQPSDVALVEEHFQSLDGASEYQWFGFWNSTKLGQRVDQDQGISRDSGFLAIALSGVTIGKVDWFVNTSWGRVDTSRCWEIAIGLFPAYRGQGHGTEAQRMLVNYLFSHYPQSRIQATTAAENTAEQRVLDKLGFTHEGTIRQSQWRLGAWHDQKLYSILRHEWETEKLELGS